MKPVRALLLLLSVFIVFALLSLIFPSGMVLSGTKIPVKIPDLSPASLFNSSKPHYADISKIISEKKQDSVVKHDTIHKNGKTISLHKVSEVIRAIEYTDSSKNAMIAFFQSLKEIKSSENTIHILHFGDSQLEGDRISDYLRSALQEEFGGSGPGLLPFSDDFYRLSINMTLSENWKRFELIHAKELSKLKKCYGPFAGFFTFTPVSKDSTLVKKKLTTGWLTIKRAGNTLNRSNKYSRCRIYMKNETDRVKIELTEGKELLVDDSIPSKQGLRIADYSFQKNPENLTIRFTSAVSPDFYAINLDSPGGVEVDNIPLRGSAGLNFTDMDKNLLLEMIDRLNVKLILLQFGVNVAPTEAENYNYYETKLFHQLTYLKSLRPDMSILVISVSDASKKNGDQYESFKNIDKLVEAQRSAAFKSGCAFWDLYDAMGGENSMPAWFAANPTLASPDFIHFNYAGARIVGKMFYNALIHDYNSYLQEKP